MQRPISLNKLESREIRISMGGNSIGLSSLPSTQNEQRSLTINI
ncbi:hypothetical protein [Coleofasciculus sp. FACHB-129]|nr:hypothetical protein [Coleofasciculus sp. FACHB-129]